METNKQARAEQEAMLGSKAHQDQLMGWIWGVRQNQRCLLDVCLSNWTDKVGFGEVDQGLHLGQVRFVWPSSQTCKISRRQWDMNLEFRQV